MTKEELKQTLEDVVTEIDHAMKIAASEVLREAYPGTDPYRMRYRDGRFILLEGLSAKAQALAALAQLEAT